MLNRFVSNVVVSKKDMPDVPMPKPTRRIATHLRRALALVLPPLLAALMTACASNHTGSLMLHRDGPEANPPPDLVRVPDAEPQLEAIKPGGANKPYEVLGRSYTPITQDAPFTERGIASWYGRAFHGKRTASGEVYNMYAMTAAHPTLPIPSYARIRNPANGREIVVRINDRGPFHGGRIVDLSYTAALKLDMLRGVGPVELQRITFDDIRTGAWRRIGDPDAVRTASAAAATGSSNIVSTGVVATVATNSNAVVDADAQGGSKAAVVVDDSSVAAGSSDAASAPPSGAASLPKTPVADAPASRAFTTPARGFWVQIGAFRAREGAENFHQRVVTEMEWLSPLLAVFNDSSLYRLQAGPYPSREEARGVAERVRDGLKLVPVIVERR